MAARVVSVLEHETIPIVEREPLSGEACLTAMEAERLLLLNNTRRGFCQRVYGGVRLAQHCGIVSLGTGILEILPKVERIRRSGDVARARGALLGMLRRAARLDIDELDTVEHLPVNAPILDVFVAAFLRCAIAQAKRGLLGRYETQTDDLTILRGHFDACANARVNHSRPHLVRCHYDEFTIDNAHNRAIRAALDACKLWITRPSTQHLWYETRARFASVSSVRMSPGDVARLARNRTTNRYRTVLGWCEWLLALASPSLTAGYPSVAAPGLLFDMNRLFEDHVSRCEELTVDSDAVVRRQGPQRHLARSGDHTDVFALRPDISIWRTTGDDSDIGAAVLRVVDAKWKLLDPSEPDWGVSRDDVYQALAYALRFGCVDVMLVYPETPESALKPPPVFSVATKGGQVRIHVRVIPV